MLPPPSPNNQIQSPPVESEFARGFGERVQAANDFVLSLNSGAKQRLVWLAGISGYIVLNAVPLWERLIGGPLRIRFVLLLGAPWVGSAMLAVLAHILFDSLDSAIAAHTQTLLAALDRFRTEDLTHVSHRNSLNDIIENTVPELHVLKMKSDNRKRLVDVFEYGCYILFGLAFILSGVIPVLIRCFHWK